jgi:ketosteroid isomerase-like protein
VTGWRFAILLPCALVATACARSTPDNAELDQQVLDTERAFARTMAERDFPQFTTFLADEAIFFSGDEPIRGKEAIAAEWMMFFEGAAAPFSWMPERIEVLDSGMLALSTGPVLSPDGTRIATFTSIWRREAPGTWRIVFDKGAPECACPSSEEP